VASSFVRSNPIELKSVLVATDLTESADKALEHGISIARHYHATLYIVHIVSSLGFTMAGPETVDLAAEVTERDIDSLTNQLIASGKLHGVEAYPIVLKGNVDAQMESFARDHPVDLIVVGTHGRQGMARLFFGSFSQLISKCCCCPVLTVGPHTSGPWLDHPVGSERPLLFASAFDKASARAMPYAISMANDFDRQLFLLHVMPSHHTYLPDKDRAVLDEKEASALAQLNALIHPGAVLKRAASILVEFGDPAEGILHTASRIHAAIIIMGARRDSFSDLTTRLPWSIANHVNREAKCPVLTVRE